MSGFQVTDVTKMIGATQMSSVLCSVPNTKTSTLLRGRTGERTSHAHTVLKHSFLKIRVMYLIKHATVALDSYSSVMFYILLPVS